MNSFTIRDLVNLSGVKAHTLRVWEQRYHFLKPERTSTKIRYYSNDELRKILNISLLNRFGYKISVIDKMDDTEMSETILSLSEAEAQQQRVINDLVIYMTRIQTEEFETTLDNYILSRGFERTVFQIIFPFLERIGLLWQTNQIIPAQEHIVSNIITRKLQTGIERLHNNDAVSKRVLLFLPEGEHHELGLLFIQYMLKLKGIKVIYMGADVPMDDVGYIINYCNPDYIYTHITTAGSGFHIEKFLTDTKKQSGQLPVIVSGKVAQIYTGKVPPKIFLKRSLEEVQNFITELAEK